MVFNNKVANNFYSPGEYPEDNIIVPGGVGMSYTAVGAESAIIKFKAPSTKTITFDFGDAFAPVNVAGNDAGEVTVNHGYGGAGTYAIKLTGDFAFITWINLTGESGFDGNLDDFLLMPVLNYLDLASTNMTGDLSDLITLTLLATLNLSGTAITGDVAVLSPMTALITLYLHNSGVNTYTQGVLPDWDGCNIKLEDNGWSQQEVDDLTTDLNTASSASVKTLTIGGTNAGPSSTGIDSVGALAEKGWTITTSIANGMTNGTFVDGTDWTTDSAWSIGGGVAHYDDSNNNYLRGANGNGATAAGKYTGVYFTITNAASGARIILYDGAGRVLVDTGLMANGVHYVSFTPTHDNALGMRWRGQTSAGAFDLDNIVMLEEA